MILDGYWKKEIKFQMKVLHSNITLYLPHDLREHVINRAILLTSIASRKVWEDEQWAEQQLSSYKSELLSSRIPVALFDYLGDPLPPGHVSPIHYKQSGKTEEPPNYIMNAVIHAYYWDLVYNANEVIEGFAVSSDQFKEQLFYVSINDWLSFLSKVVGLSHIY